MIQIDMPMPVCCNDCFALDDYGDYPSCLISHDQRGYNFRVREQRMPSCPLKAQEPRVMTLEEANAVEVVWVEDRGTDTVFPCLVKNNMNDSKLYKYGIQWRVWSSRPSEEQRKAVKWDG